MQKEIIYQNAVYEMSNNTFSYKGSRECNVKIIVYYLNCSIDFEFWPPITINNYKVKKIFNAQTQVWNDSKFSRSIYILPKYNLILNSYAL